MTANATGGTDYFDNAPCGYLTLDQDLIITEVNNTLLKWLGYKKVDLLGKTCNDIANTGVRLYFHTHILPSMLGEGFIQEIHTSFLNTAGTSVSVLLNGRYLKEKNKFLFSIMRIEHRRRYEEELLLAKRKAESDAVELLKLNEELTNFAFVLTHDLKAPLNNVVSLTKLLKTGISKYEPSKIQEILDNINASTTQFSELIEGVLSQYNIHKAASVKNQVDDLGLFFTSMAKLIDVQDQFNITYPSVAGVSVAINEFQLKQIFINLLSNSIKYTLNKDFNIKIQYWTDARFHFFSVEDHGVGIKKADQEKIFNLFEVSSSLDRFGRVGTGIGLSTVKKIVEKNGGALQIESEENVGTKITFSLMRKPAVNAD